MGSIVGNLMLLGYSAFTAGLKIKNGGSKMCLDKLLDFKVKLDENGVGVGWKYFRMPYSSCSKLLGDFRSTAMSRPKNKWLKEGNFRDNQNKNLKMIDSLIGGYPFGFHVFLTEYGALKWSFRSRKVKFRKVVATGLRGGCRCVVVKEIFIPNEGA